MINKLQENLRIMKNFISNARKFYKGELLRSMQQNVNKTADYLSTGIEENEKKEKNENEMN